MYPGLESTGIAEKTARKHLHSSPLLCSILHYILIPLLIFSSRKPGYSRRKVAASTLAMKKMQAIAKALHASWNSLTLSCLVTSLEIPNFSSGKWGSIWLSTLVSEEVGLIQWLQGLQGSKQCQEKSSFPYLYVPLLLNPSLHFMGVGQLHITRKADITHWIWPNISSLKVPFPY